MCRPCTRTRTLLRMLASIRPRTPSLRRRMPPDQPYTCIVYCNVHVRVNVSHVCHINVQVHACITNTRLCHGMLLFYAVSFHLKSLLTISEEVTMAILWPCISRYERTNSLAGSKGVLSLFCKHRLMVDHIGFQRMQASTYACGKVCALIYLAGIHFTLCVRACII